MVATRFKSAERRGRLRRDQLPIYALAQFPDPYELTLWQEEGGCRFGWGSVDDRWLAHFTATVDGLFAGEKAEHIKSAASDMANVIHAKINGVERARFDYSKPTPEQRERCASYRAKAAS